MLRFLRGLVRVVFVVVVLGAVGLGGFVAITLMHFSRELPDTQQLINYVPATGSKIYAGDGAFMSEFEAEHRIPVPIGKVPKLVIQAFLAAEDRDFYSHNGVNPGAIFRAAMADILRFQRGQRPMGASTITQQVVRHFLLTNEVSISRKIKEALLAYRIEKNLSKDRILEIYLNEIYLGAGAYGVAAAADTYFQKPLDQLTLAETALVAALPKAPNNYNPIRHQHAAKSRRDWILAGMAELGWITQSQAKSATAEPIALHLRPDTGGGANGYFAEEVRRELVGRFGEKAVYEGGLSVRTSYVPVYQEMAETAFRKGLIEYDRRHGWRGPFAHYSTPAEAQSALASMADPPGIPSWQLAAVTGIDAAGATIALRNGGSGRLPLDELRWARRTLDDQRLGAAVRQVRDVVNLGDIVIVEPVAAPAPPAPAKGAKGHAPPLPVLAHYGLRQIPDVSGGTVVMDPKTGRVFAMVGGWSFQQSQFNRATQAKRQPGSSFKPFVYVTALQNGFTPQSTVEDSPVDISQGPGLPAWQPVNYEGNFVGTTTLEDALVHSRNLATVHVAQTIGLPVIARTVQDFDIMDRMPLYYSMSLGAGETTLLRLTTAYAMLDNDGHWLLPSVIDLVQDRNGKIIYQKGVNGCAGCFVAAGPRSTPDNSPLYRAIGPADPASIWLQNASYGENALVYKPTKKDPLITPDADAEIIDMMQGVVQRGTGIAVSAVGKPIAGKTGTTSDWFDAWFVGFSPDLTAGVFVGFDDPRTLGNGETGGHVAAPIFRDFMTAALKDKPAKPFVPPPGASVAVASASPSMNTGSSSGKASPSGSPNTDLASLADTSLTAPDDSDTAVVLPKRRQGKDAASDYNAATSDAATVPWPDYSQPMPDYAARSPDYGSSRAPGYAASRAPSYQAYQAYPPVPLPQYGAPQVMGYAAAPQYSGYGYPAQRSSDYYSAPRAPAYGPWGVRPGYGTGGLY